MKLHFFPGGLNEDHIGGSNDCDWDLVYNEEVANV
jgi:hypothetical protein